MFMQPLLSQNRKVGSTGAPAVHTLGTPVATTSGTQHNITGIPSNAKQIEVTFEEVSTNGTSIYELKIGPVGGVEETGYTGFAFRGQTSGVAGSAWPTDAIRVNTGPAAGHLYSGTITLTLQDPATNTWTVFGGVSDGASQTNVTCGRKALAGALERIRLTTLNGTDTFDNGSINILVKT